MLDAFITGKGLIIKDTIFLFIIALACILFRQEVSLFAYRAGYGIFVVFALRCGDFYCFTIA